MIPVLAIPKKATNDVDFGPSFRDYIQNHYQEDPSTYDREIRELNDARNQMVYAENTIVGRDFVYRYFGQLELLNLRFPIDEDHVKVEFEWKDAFSGDKVSQYSVAFEKACVLFNLGSLCSAIAASADRSNADGLKKACNYFQAAAGLFQFINDNFLHPPSVDLSRESIAVLVKLCIAQAQECFIEKMLADSKSGALVSKLAMFTSETYKLAADGMSELYGQFDKSWIGLAKCKVKYYSAMAYYHRALFAETKNEFGDIISYILIASAESKEAVKLATSVTNTSLLMAGIDVLLMVDNSNDTFKNDLNESINNLDKLIALKTAIAKKDNDTIYNALVVPLESLPALDKVAVAKEIPFYDLLANGQKDLSSIVGYDIFSNLVPLGVHESASIYSDEKDKLLRNARQAVENADADLHVTIESLEIMQTLEKIKGNAKPISPPKQLIDTIMTINSREKGQSSLQFLQQAIGNSRVDMQKLLDEIIGLLDREQYECEQQRLKHLEKWTQEPSSNLSISFKQEWASLRSVVQENSNLPQQLTTKLLNLRRLLEVARLSPNEVDAEFVREVVPDITRRPSLLDSEIEVSPTVSEPEQIAKVEQFLATLKIVKSDRKAMFDNLKNELDVQEDLSTRLLLAKGREHEVFASELEKFKPLQDQLKQNITYQRNMLEDLQKEFNSLKARSKKLASQEQLESKSKTLVEDWERDVNLYFEVVTTLEESHSTLNDSKNKLILLQRSVMEFVQRRNSERERLVRSIESTSQVDYQQELRSQLAQVNISQNSSPTRGYPAPIPSAQSPLGSLPRPSGSAGGFQPLPPPKPFAATAGNTLPQPSLHQAPYPVNQPSYSQPFVPLPERPYGSLPPPVERPSYVPSGLPPPTNPSISSPSPYSMPYQPGVYMPPTQPTYQHPHLPQPPQGTYPPYMSSTAQPLQGYPQPPAQMAYGMPYSNQYPNPQGYPPQQYPPGSQPSNPRPPSNLLD